MKGRSALAQEEQQKRVVRASSSPDAHTDRTTHPRRMDGCGAAFRAAFRGASVTMPSSGSRGGAMLRCLLWLACEVGGGSTYVALAMPPDLTCHVM